MDRDLIEARMRTFDLSWSEPAAGSRESIPLGNGELGANIWVDTEGRIQKFLLAAAGRGRFPIKFNGSLFTAEWEFEEENFGPDYRRWGGGYWFQNTRLIYWALLPLGCPDMMEPFSRILGAEL